MAICVGRAAKARFWLRPLLDHGKRRSLNSADEGKKKKECLKFFKELEWINRMKEVSLCIIHEFMVFVEAELKYMYNNNISYSMNTIRRKILTRFQTKWLNDILLYQNLNIYSKQNYGPESCE